MGFFQSVLFGIVSFFASIVGAICGIGGGPINLVVLYFFYSMDTKTAAANSLYVILYSRVVFHCAERHFF